MCNCINKTAFKEDSHALIEKNRQIWFETEGKKIKEEIERQILFGKAMKLGSKTFKREKKHR